MRPEGYIALSILLYEHYDIASASASSLDKNKIEPKGQSFHELGFADDQIALIMSSSDIADLRARTHADISQLKGAYYALLRLEV